MREHEHIQEHTQQSPDRLLLHICDMTNIMVL